MRRHSLGFAVAVLAASWAAPAAAQGCAAAAPGAATRVAVGDTGRTMILHVPKGFKPGERAPLVLLLHGSGSDGAKMLDSAGLAETADRHGFLVAAPDAGIPSGSGFVWNIPGVPSVTGRMPAPGDADDVAFLGAAIDWLAAEGCVDPARVYATGFSGGARMTSWLACVAPARFAAIAPVAGLRAGNPSISDPQVPDPATCQPGLPVPVMTFTGGADTTNPVDGGGAKYWQYSMRAAEARWAGLNGCRRPLPDRTLANGTVEQGYADCRDGAEVIARITPGAGHAWVADNEAMWAFFERYRRR